MISNATANTPLVQFSISSAFYGSPFTSSWTMKDYNSGQVIHGTGDPYIDRNLPANDWVVYVSQ